MMASAIDMAFAVLKDQYYKDNEHLTVNELQELIPEDVWNEIPWIELANNAGGHYDPEGTGIDFGNHIVEYINTKDVSGDWDDPETGKTPDFIHNMNAAQQKKKNDIEQRKIEEALKWYENDRGTQSSWLGHQ